MIQVLEIVAKLIKISELCLIILDDALWKLLIARCDVSNELRVECLKGASHEEGAVEIPAESSS